MNARAVLLGVEGISEQRFMEAILAGPIKAKRVRIENCMTQSGAISLAQTSLLHSPEPPIALVLNSGEDDPEEMRASITRLVSWASPTGWHLSLAIPTLAVWAVADARVRKAFGDKDPAAAPADGMDYINLAKQMKDLVRGKPFDVASLRKAQPEFRALEQFLEQEAGVAARV